MRLFCLATIVLFVTAPAFGQSVEQSNRVNLPVADPAFKGKIGETFRDSRSL